VRRGYWTGFIVGGILGMVAAKAYGDRLLDSMFPGMVGETGEAEGLPDEYDSYSYKARRRRRIRREF